MTTVLRHTEYLMTMHDCVVIPGFGAMLRRRRPSYCDEQGRLVPPGHSYAFNGALVEDDGLLVSSVARAEALSYARAAERVACDVDVMLRRLREDGRLAMGRLGAVTFDGDSGVMQYEAPAADTLTPMADWLPVVAPVVEEVEEEAPARSHKPVPNRMVRRVVRLARTAAAVAAIAAVAIVCSTPIEVGNAGFASTALPSVSAPREAYVPSVGVKSMEIVVDGSGSEALDTAARSAWQQTHVAADAASILKSTDAADAAANEPNDAVSRFNSNDRYVVVVATHRTLKAAETTSAQFAGTFDCQTRVVRSGSVWFVVAASADTREEAVAALRTPEIQRFKDAWVAALN
ncbi:MAG: hypothetical protein ACI30P_04280 [Muribaculaceae bacterium]